MVGAAGNIAYGAVNHLSIFYALTSVALGFIVGFGVRKRWMAAFYGLMVTASLSVLAAVAVISYTAGAVRFSRKDLPL
jgi:energy-coupling factor transport system substrate-specific component